MSPAIWSYINDASNQFLSVLSRRHMKTALEQPIKVREIFVSAFFRDSQHGVVRGKKETRCHRKAVVIQIINKRNAHGVLKEFHEVGLGEPRFFCDITSGKRLHIVIFHIFDHRTYAVEAAALSHFSCLRHAIGEKDMKKKV